MKPWKITIIAALAAIAVALTTVSALAFNNGFFNPSVNRGGRMGGYGNYGGSCGGMVRGGYSPYHPGNVSYATQITIDNAVTIAKGYLTSLNNPDLAVGHVEEYTQNFYVMYYEKSTDMGAFEMLIDKSTGNMYPEMGPNMMWNTKYGMMSQHAGRMMGGYRTTTATPMTVTVDQAKTAAQQFLNTYYAGTTVGDVTTFYGYYTIEVFSSGSVYGMLSVNGYTEQVWYHTWHGTFIQEWSP